MASNLAEALALAPFDVALFAIKSFDTTAAIEEITPEASRMPPILCLQNGVDNEPALAAAFGQEGVIAGTVTSAIGRTGIGEIVLERLRGVGIAAGNPLSNTLVQAFNAAPAIRPSFGYEMVENAHKFTGERHFGDP